MLGENNVLKCLADEKSLLLVRSIHKGLPVTITGMKLTRKQYYRKLNMISDANLISRSSGRYAVTSLGRVILGLLDSLEVALSKDYWKFLAIDNLTSADTSIPVEVRTGIISSILESENMTEALLKH
jgi:predicted transcriptional regulator